VTLKDSPAHALHAYPGDSSVSYSEGILVGYRWFDTKNIKPLFCFGFGLSYTSITYSDFAVQKPFYGIDDTIRVEFKLKNTGHRPGVETVQLYIGKPDSKVLRPAKELKAFKKEAVEAGREAIVALSVPVKDLSYFDESQMKWIVEPGTYALYLASSSQDVKDSLNVKVE
jgi:beta-glucosidase